MVSRSNINIVTELGDFLRELTIYHSLQRRRLKGERLNTDEFQLVAKLRNTLLSQSDIFRPFICDKPNKQYMTYIGEDGKERSYDILLTGLKFEFDSLSNGALDYCKDATTVAIGKLEYDIKRGIRDEQGEIIVKREEEHPKCFVSHGKESAALRKLKEFLETLGIEPLIVKKRASLDKDLPDKVNLYLSQADFVIILATADDTVKDKKTGTETKQPRQNVIHEIGLAQKTREGKVIYLLEEGAEFPSNIRPKVWESFKQRNMMDAFLGIVRELRAYGILKCVKP